MRSSVAVVHELVSGLTPLDEAEAEHQADTLRWLAGTDDVFRRARPDVPSRHLVSYVVPVDRADGSVLLVDHVLAGLWLPPGGHVEPDEHPVETARREAYEELGLTARVDTTPVFLTVTRTVGQTAGHTDVSLWFVLPVDRAQPFTSDRREFRSARWWTPGEVAAVDQARFDPHLPRFLTKLGRQQVC